MTEDAHLTAAKDRIGRFSGYYKCSLCNAEFRPNPKDLREISNFFAAHVKYTHPASETTRPGHKSGAAARIVKEATRQSDER